MHKFKIGDVIVYSKVLYAEMDFCIGDKFEVTTVCDHARIKIKPVSDYRRSTLGYFTVDQFELADHTLTPEEVLQYFKEDRQHELEYTQPNGTVLGTMTEYTGINYLLTGTWRVKPAPKTIDYYGTELPKPVTREEAEAEGLDTVYRTSLLGERLVRAISKACMIDHYIYFRTESEALQVAEVLLKPFK